MKILYTFPCNYITIYNYIKTNTWKSHIKRNKQLIKYWGPIKQRKLPFVVPRQRGRLNCASAKGYREQELFHRTLWGTIIGQPACTVWNRQSASRNVVLAGECQWNSRKMVAMAARWNVPTHLVRVRRCQRTQDTVCHIWCQVKMMLMFNKSWSVSSEGVGVRWYQWS
jgi:hypothetical protein